MEADLRNGPIDGARAQVYLWYVSNSTSSGGTRLRILLADDHEPFRKQVRNLLRKKSGLELVGEAGDGEEAVRLARELEPAVVIMDVLMPRLNGIEATRRITTESPSVKVIALSMHGDEGFRRAMLDAGAATYLLKDNVLHELPRALLSIVTGSA